MLAKSPRKWCACVQFLARKALLPTNDCVFVTPAEPPHATPRTPVQPVAPGRQCLGAHADRRVLLAQPMVRPGGGPDTRGDADLRLRVPPRARPDAARAGPRLDAAVGRADIGLLRRLGAGPAPGKVARTRARMARGIRPGEARRML